MSNLSKRLRALRDAARAATQGEWSTEPHSNGGHTLFSDRNTVVPGSEGGPFGPMTGHGLNLLNISDLDWNGEANLHFIATASPEMVLELFKLLDERYLDAIAPDWNSEG